MRNGMKLIGVQKVIYGFHTCMKLTKIQLLSMALNQLVVGIGARISGQYSHRILTVYRMVSMLSLVKQ